MSYTHFSLALASKAVDYCGGSIESTNSGMGVGDRRAWTRKYEDAYIFQSLTVRSPWCIPEFSGPQDFPTLNDEGSRTTPIKNIKLLNDSFEAREQGNRRRFKRYEASIKLYGFEKSQLFGQCQPPLSTVSGPVNRL